jgi:hypothetical protein
LRNKNIFLYHVLLWKIKIVFSKRKLHSGVCRVSPTELVHVMLWQIKIVFSKRKLHSVCLGFIYFYLFIVIYCRFTLEMLCDLKSAHLQFNVALYFSLNNIFHGKVFSNSWRPKANFMFIMLWKIWFFEFQLAFPQLILKS